MYIFKNHPIAIMLPDKRITIQHHFACIDMYLNNLPCVVFKINIVVMYFGISYSIDIRQNAFTNRSIIAYSSKHSDGLSSKSVSAKNQLDLDKGKTSNPETHICTNIQYQCDLESTYNSDLSRNTGDTTNQDDIVRRQYSSLPYPAVTEDNLFLEKNHYDRKLENIRPYGISQQLALEKINHYLYNGDNDFT